MKDLLQLLHGGVLEGTGLFIAPKHILRRVIRKIQLYPRQRGANQGSRNFGRNPGSYPGQAARTSAVGNRDDVPLAGPFGFEPVVAIRAIVLMLTAANAGPKQAKT